MERQILIAMFSFWLDGKLNELRRDIWPKLKSLNLEQKEEARVVLFDCLEEAFKKVFTEQKEKGGSH